MPRRCLGRPLQKTATGKGCQGRMRLNRHVRTHEQARQLKQARRCYADLVEGVNALDAIAINRLVARVFARIEHLGISPLHIVGLEAGSRRVHPRWLHTTEGEAVQVYGAHPYACYMRNEQVYQLDHREPHLWQLIRRSDADGIRVVSDFLQAG